MSTSSVVASADENSRRDAIVDVKFTSIRLTNTSSDAE